MDPTQLRELLGEAELRELLDASAIADLEKSLQRTDGHRPVAHADALHDLLLSLGDLAEPEIAARCTPPEAAAGWIAELRVRAPHPPSEDRRRASLRRRRGRRPLPRRPPRQAPRQIPAALLEPVADPLGNLVSRYARTHGPFLLDTIAARFGLGPAPVRAALERLAAAGRVVEGEISPGVRAREWCDAEVLRQLKRRSLARLRKEVEPVEPAALGRFLAEWHGLHRPRSGPDALLTVVEQLQGAPIPASVLETDILPARVKGYLAGDVDRLCAMGEVAWIGLEPLGPRDGRIALYLPDQLPFLAPAARQAESALAAKLRDLFEKRGALFFSDLLAETGAFSHDVLAALWEMVWAGEVTNDTLAPLRGLLHGAAAEKKGRERRLGLRGMSFGGRRAGPPGSEGRWSLVGRSRRAPSETERRAALARTLLERYGVLTREAAAAEGVQGGFSAVYEVLKAMEEAGKVRRGYFVAGLGATQFALPGADDRLRAVREAPAEARVLVLAATDPANPYGAALAWPGDEEGKAGRAQRAAGAYVVLRDGAVIGYLGRSERDLVTFLPAEEPDRGHAAEALARALAGIVESGRRKTLLVEKIDGVTAEGAELGRVLAEVGFSATSKGYFKRGVRREE